MKVSINWLKELVDLNVSVGELVNLLPLRTIGTKEVTDKFIELDMKGYNRTDLLSMRGIAYEVAAITDSEVKFTEIDEFIWTKKNLQDVQTKVQSNLCNVYCIAKIEGLRVGPSSKEWVEKLVDGGMRPVNNIADVTNLIMLEYGQPLHAFDAQNVTNQTLIVRSARENEQLITLDGKERTLDSDDLLIADPEKPLGLAGVMGGKNSEVTDSTETILLEAAIFDPVTIRKTVTRHNLPSEASKRFQHGLTKKRLLQALDAAIKMYEELGGKLTTISLTGDFKDEHKKIQLNHQKINSLIGVKIKKTAVEDYLNKLGFNLIAQSDSPQIWEVEVPYWRLDVNLEEDLIEEVARMYGYEKIPAKPLEGKLPEKIDQFLENLIHNLKNNLIKTGLTEVQTYSFYSSQTLQALDLTKAAASSQLIKIANPISAETEYMREDIWPNLVEVIDKNTRQRFKDIAVFEIGKVYKREKERTSEQYRLSLALMNGTDNPTAELYQLFQALLEFKEIALGDNLNDEAAKKLFHPNRNKTLLKKGKQIGGIAEVHPRILNQYGLEKRVAILEIELQPLL